MALAGIDKDMAPIAEATLALHMTRERIIRSIQRGELEGAQIAGRWFVSRAALAAAAKEHAA